MPVTIVSSIANYPASNPAITAKILLQHGTVAINGAGAGSSVTMGLLNTASFTFSDTIAAGLYEVRYYTSTVELGGGTVWIESASTGSYKVDDPIRMAIYQQRLQQNLESPERATTDTRALEFDWLIGQTFANSASTCTRLFPGESAASAEALSGAITLVRTGRYAIAYAVADRVQTGSTVIPTEVLYTLVDDLGNIGYLTLRVTSRLVTGPAVGVDVALTTVSGVIVGPLIIGDDYDKDDDARAFVFTITTPTGFVFAGASCFLGFYKDVASNSITTGTVTNNLDATLTMRFGLGKTTTQDFSCGNYQYSVELRDAAGIEVTHVHSKKRRIEFVSKFT